MADVVVRLDEEKARHLREILNGDVPMPEVHCHLCQELRAALDSPPVEERVEYRVVATGAVAWGDETIPAEDEEHAQHLADQQKRFHPAVRIETRSVLVSPWSALEEGTG